MSKLIVISNDLDSGGAQKSAIKFCLSTHNEGASVTLCTITNHFDFYEVPSCIKRINLDDGFQNMPLRLPFRIGINFALNLYKKFVILNRLRRLVRVEKPDCVISFSARTNVFTFFALYWMRVPIVGSERIHPDYKIFSHGKIVDHLRPYIYKHGMFCSVQSSEVLVWCKDFWGVDSFITPNHLLVESRTVADLHEINFDGPLITVGRDDPQKGLEVLLDAWKFVKPEIRARRLLIIGPSNVSNLERTVLLSGLSNIEILPRTNDLSPFYERASILVSSSNFEGFPNVVLEAISFGLPIVATRSCGVIEELENLGGCVGVPVGDSRRLAIQINKLFANTELLKEMSSRAPEILKNYTWETVGKSWGAVIETAISTKSRIGRKSI